MEAKSTLLRIPLLALHEVISYLNTKEVYYILARVCREFRDITKNSKEIPINLIRGIAGGSNETTRILSGFKLLTLLGLLQSIYSDTIELPYHGFLTDGGCYDHNAQYFMDRIFQARYGDLMDAFSSQPGDEFHVEGVLALDYLDSKKLLHKLAVNDGVNDKLLERYMQYEKEKKTVIQTVLTKAFISNDKNHIEISHFPLEETSSVITSIEVRRPRFFTCLTKTIVVFCSDEPIDFSDPLLEAFSGVSRKHELEDLYKTSAAKLPRIEATNIPSLKKYAREKYYEPIVEKADTTEMVLFSNKVNSKVKVVAWMRILPATLRIVQVHLKSNNYFSGKYVVGKLLDRDELNNTEEPNLDLKSISLKGTLLTQNEVLMNTLKSYARVTPIWDNF